MGRNRIRSGKTCSRISPTSTQAASTKGIFPKAFRSAEVIFLRKMNKPDPSKIKAWRPISLISVISKGLKRLVARRMARLAIQHNVLYP
jgi:hypothetical protein